MLLLKCSCNYILSLQLEQNKYTNRPESSRVRDMAASTVLTLPSLHLSHAHCRASWALCFSCVFKPNLLCLRVIVFFPSCMVHLLSRKSNGWIVHLIHAAGHMWNLRRGEGISDLITHPQRVLLHSVQSPLSISISSEYLLQKLFP